MDQFSSDTWCDECGDLGWSGVCPACLEFEAHPTEFAIPSLTADA